jgi:hypothetical protein
VKTSKLLAVITLVSSAESRGLEYKFVSKGRSSVYCMNNKGSRIISGEYHTLLLPVGELVLFLVL